MKILILALTLFTVLNVKAEAISYTAPEFKSCYSLYFKSYGSADATARCEAISREELLNVLQQEAYGICYHYSFKTYSSADAANSCLEYYKKGDLGIFQDQLFQKCYQLHEKSFSSVAAIESCIKYKEQNELALFGDQNFLQCQYLKEKTYSSADAVSDCAGQFRNQFVSTRLSLDRVNENIQVPENTQVILTAPLEIPGNSTCASITNGEREVKCWVCRGKKSRNDVLYQLEKDEHTGVDQKILPVESSVLSSNGKEIHFQLVQDPSDTDNLSTVLCNSKSVLQIKNKSELIPIFEKNGLKLIFPAAKVK